VKEAAKELGREGMRCGEGRGSHRPFIGAGGAPGRGGRGGNGGVNCFNTIEEGGEVRGELRGSDGGASNGSGQHPEVWSWAARGVEGGGGGAAELEPSRR
jgi:hypothetical protein